ncbi:hypothetical protein MPSEU_000682400 [Mayamaea pseudoterrestris]|nr:hypothetical protein MPSEU_000682400 [Mayamaea pseudoterrestris]
MALSSLASSQSARAQWLPTVQRLKDRMPRPTPMHYTSAMVLLVIILFNAPFHHNKASQLRYTEHCLDLELAVEATAASMRHASSQHYPKGFCQRLPLHQSAPWIWNHQAQQILDATFDPLRDGSSKWLADAFDALPPMSLTTRGRPQHDVWGAFINKIELRMSEDDLLQQANPIKVLVIGSHYDASVSCAMKGASSPFNVDCSWPARLQTLIDFYFGIGIIQIDVQSLEHDTTSLLTHAIQTNQLGAHNADLIIYGMSSQELHRDAMLSDVNLEHAINMDARVKYYQRLLLRVQNFIRACLDSQPCEEYVPPVLLVDDYVGGLHDKILIEYSMTRALQQVADHYRIGYVSYPHLVRKIVMTDATNDNPWAPDWSKNKKNIQHGRGAHVGFLWSLLYNFLEYTIDYCSHESDIQEYRQVQKNTKLVENWVIDRIQQPPPYLNGDLLWTNVSPQWKESVDALELRKRNVCAGRQRQSRARQCSFAMWGRGSDGSVMTAAATQAMLKPYMKRMSGFTILDGGIIRASQPHATLELVVHDEDRDVDQASLFLGPGEMKVLQDPMNQLDNAELKLTITSGTANATTSTTVNVVDRMSWQQDIPENEPGQAIHLLIELVAGATVDIVALFLCTSEDVSLYGNGAWVDRNNR